MAVLGADGCALYVIWLGRSDGSSDAKGNLRHRGLEGRKHNEQQRVLALLPPGSSLEKARCAVRRSRLECYFAAGQFVNSNVAFIDF